jgi:uncharacterized alpha-E superfamily protein
VSSVRDLPPLYRDQIFPIKVAQLLILERRMPRSLAACFDQIEEALSASRPERPVGEAPRLRAARAALHADIEEMFQGGLHEYLTDVLEDIGELGSRIQRAYLGAA